MLLRSIRATQEEEDRACSEVRVFSRCRLQEVNKQWSESPFIADNVNALSAEARDLLDRIFVLDPSKRITVPEIMRHPWCAAQRI